MADLWYPEATKNPAPTSLWGPKQTADTGLLHSTESLDTFYPAKDNYYGHTYYPHFTVNSKGVWQHIPVNYAARALVNKPGGVETNRSDVIQIEIAWQAEKIRDIPLLTMEHLRKLMRWCEAVSIIPRRSTVDWVSYPKSYGEKASQRLHGIDWVAYRGWLGHQHADENDHGDPGDIDIAWLLDVPEPPAEEFLDMTEAELKAILDEYFNKEGFGDITLQQRTGMVKAWQMPDGTIANQTYVDGKVAIQYQTDPKVVQAWVALGVFPNPIPKATPEMVEKMKSIRVITGS